MRTIIKIIFCLSFIFIFSSCMTFTGICELDENIINSDNSKLHSCFYSLNSNSYNDNNEPLTYVFEIDIDTNTHWYPEIKIKNIVITNENKSKLDTLNITKIYCIGSEEYLAKTDTVLSEINFNDIFFEMEGEYKHVRIFFETNRKVKEVENLFVDLNFVFNGKQYDILNIRYKKCTELWSPLHMVFRENDW